MPQLSMPQAVKKLNKMLAQDRLALTHLVDLRVDCGALKIFNPAMAVHMSFYDRPLMGIVELLNALFDGKQLVACTAGINGLKCFKLVPRPVISTPKTDAVKRAEKRHRKIVKPLRRRNLIKELGLL